MCTTEGELLLSDHEITAALLRERLPINDLSHIVQLLIDLSTVCNNGFNNVLPCDVFSFLSEFIKFLYYSENWRTIRSYVYQHGLHSYTLPFFFFFAVLSFFLQQNMGISLFTALLVTTMDFRMFPGFRSCISQRLDLGKTLEVSCLRLQMRNKTSLPGDSTSNA